MEKNATIKYTIRLPKGKIRQAPSLWDRFSRLTEGSCYCFPQYFPHLALLDNTLPLIHDVCRNIENYISRQAGRKAIKVQYSIQEGGEECLLIQEGQEGEQLVLLALRTSWCNDGLLAQVETLPRFLIETLLSRHASALADFEEYT